MTNDDNLFRPLSEHRKKKPKPERSANTWAALHVVPSTAEAKPERHPRLGLPSHVYEYRRANNVGRLLRLHGPGCANNRSNDRDSGCDNALDWTPANTIVDASPNRARLRIA